MTELKTLKDIERIDKDWLCGAVNIDELKAEAVKWVKERHTGDWFELFKHFFNLTEEDLK